MKKGCTLFLMIIVWYSCNKNIRSVQIVDLQIDYQQNAVLEEKIANDTAAWKYQMAAYNFAKKGDYRQALATWDLAMERKDTSFTKKQIDSINLKYTKLDARDYIIEQAKKNQVVIINEAHHNSMHRAFTKSLLQDLYDQGYTHLGLEALTNDGKITDTLLNERKYPVQKTGFYTKDPQFGELIRTALTLGYQVFPYEAKHGLNGKPREIDQAKKIKKVMDTAPNAKFLIHCGFDHVLEGKYQNWEKAMAGRLKEYTGIDPLTINQVFYSEKGNTAFNHPLLKAVNVRKPSILVDKNKEVYKYQRKEAWADIAVFHPNTSYVDGRPNWLFMYGNQHVVLSLKDIRMYFPVMVLAYKKGEDLTAAIPVDITEVESANKKCHLGLSQGDYEIVVTNGRETVKFEHRVVNKSRN